MELPIEYLLIGLDGLDSAEKMLIDFINGWIGSAKVFFEFSGSHAVHENQRLADAPAE